MTVRAKLIMAVCLAILVAAMPGARASQNHKHVLMITSYHHGDRWNDDLIAGVRQSLDALSDISLAIEHLDLRRNAGAQYELEVAAFLKTKYRDKHKDLIIVSDDAALDFLLKVRAELFADVPVVFCGINNFTPQRVQGQDRITGVNETVSVAQTLDLALRLFPATGQVFAVVDDRSAVGRANLEHFQAAAQRLASRAALRELLNLTAGEAPDVLRALPPDSLVLRLNNLLDGHGGFLSIAESMNVISAQSPVPVFTLWDFDLGLGALGGIVVSGFEQGRQAGELAGRILGGASVDRIPVVMRSPNVPMFDFQQMERFGLSKRDLPASALILNKPLSMLDEFKAWFWAGVLIMGLLAALILVLLATMACRRKAAKILAESEKDLAAMFNAIPDSLLLVDPEGQVIAINSTATLRLGERPEEIVGRSIYGFLPAHVADSRRLRMEQALCSGEPVLFEDQRDGRFFSNHLYPIRNVQGQVDRLFIFGQDITEHRSIQDALFRQKELLESISNVQDLFISGEEPGKVYQDMLQILVSATGSAYGFLDEALRDADGTPYKLSLAMSDISWDEGSRSLYQQLAERKLEFRNLDNLSGAPVLERRVVIANNAPAHPRYRGLPKGHPPLSSFLGIPLFFKGEVIGVAGVANRPGGYDMNLVRLLAPLTKTCAAMIWAGRLEKRRRQAVEALRQSEERYRCIAETANEGVWVLGADYRTTFVNRHMAEMLGLAPEQMLGRPRHDFMFAEDHADHEERMHWRSRGRAEIYERRFRHESGAEIWTIASATPLLDEHGRVTGSFAMFTDITERKAAEEELKAASQALRQALEEKDAFFSIIAHDLRSPISGLLGLTGLLIDEQGLSQEDLRTVSVEMARSVRTIFDLLENLLEWSRMQRGLTAFNPAPRDLSEAARDCAELARSAAEQKNVTLRLDVPDDCLVSADEHMLSAILRNLVFNALKFSHPGGAVTVSAQPGRNAITVAVADEGVGMDEQTLASLFVLSCKKSRPGTVGEKGTGLGLVLCKEFIEKHGGTIHVESRPGRGTTFFFTLPTAREVA